MYLSGRAYEFFKKPSLYGVMLSYKKTGYQRIALLMGCEFMVDNGMFSGKFDFMRWLSILDDVSVFAENCHGVVLPDAVILDENNNFVKGDWRGTLNMFYAYSEFVADRGLPLAYALQDDHPPDLVPYDEIDCLFIAGTTEYKLSQEAKAIALRAKAMGIHIHVARVSSVHRMELCDYADTFDGTTFRWQPAVKHRRFDPYLEYRRDMKARFSAENSDF